MQVNFGTLSDQNKAGDFGTSNSMQELGSDMDTVLARRSEEKETNNGDVNIMRQTTVDASKTTDPSPNIDFEADERLQTFLKSISTQAHKDNPVATDPLATTIQGEELDKNGNGGKISAFSRIINRLSIDVYTETVPYLISPSIDLTHIILTYGY